MRNKITQTICLACLMAALAMGAAKDYNDKEGNYDNNQKSCYNYKEDNYDNSKENDRQNCS